MRNFLNRYIYETIFLLIFVIFLPLFSNINFYQNDDWNRNSTLERFMKYDFSLLDVTATTFYSQGFMGFFWSQIFGTKKIPILTLLITIINSLILFKILEKSTNLKRFTFFLLSLLLLFNPLNAYSSIGFMTENYLMFYFLFSIYFFISYQKNHQIRDFIVSNIFSFLAFYAKQNAVILPLAMTFYFLIKKRFREFFYQLSFTLFTVFSYLLFFPRTSEMKEKDSQFVNLFNFDYNFTLVYGILIYLSFFVLPLIFILIYQKIKEKNYFQIAGISLISIFLFIVLNHNFKPGLISWEEFPYFENTFERTGFLPRTLDGTKYQFKFNYDLYFYIDIVSKVGVCFLISFFLFNLKKIDLFYILTFIGGIGILFFVAEFYDRYILILVPIIILLVSKFLKESFLLNITLIIYVLLFSFFSYFLTTDFILTHNYVWSKSEELSKQGVLRENIYSCGAWRRLYKNQKSDYLFSYDSFSKNPSLKESYDLVEVKNIEFIGNLFIDPRVFLYKRKE